MDSIIDWYLVNELYKNIDAAFGTSVFLHKDKNGKLKMGPVWDFDVGAGNVEDRGGDNPVGYYVKNGLWLSRFFEDPAFRLRLAERWKEVRNNQMVQLFSLIEETGAALERSQQENFKKWDILGKYFYPNPPGWQQRITYQSEVDYFTNWLEARANWFDQEFVQI